MAADDLTGAAVAKRLASCNKATRDRALRLLWSWLSTSTSASTSDDDLLKIWKGLFYCVWHADKLSVQLDLIDRLASLLLALDQPLASRYFAAFFATIRREWSGIDHLRLDKFYILIRRFLHHFFAFLKKSAWDSGVVADMVAVVSEKTLLVVDRYPAQGVNYHIAQVFLDEIREFLPVGLETLDALLKPFFSVVETSSDKTFIGKIKVSVFDRLLENGHRYLRILKAGDAVESGSEVEKLGKIGLVFGFSKRFLDLASSESTVQSCRKFLFDLHGRFSKLEADLEKSGIQVSLAVENGDLGNGFSDTLHVQNLEIPAVDCTKQTDTIPFSDSCNLEDRPSKRMRKSKKDSSTVGKTSVRHKHVVNSESIDNKTVGVSVVSNSILGNDEGLFEDVVENGNSITFDEIVMSNLQKQFENVAAEEGMLTPVASAKAKKRKRVKTANGMVSRSPKALENVDGKASCSPKAGKDGFTIGKSAEKSVKKVRFSMKNNLVWKPHSPLPPHSLRLPPSATPRGSALKKGVSPGPVKETPPTSKKAKAKVKASSMKKVRRSTKSVTPSVKRLRKLQNSV